MMMMMMNTNVDHLQHRLRGWVESFCFRLSGLWSSKLRHPKTVNVYTVPSRLSQSHNEWTCWWTEKNTTTFL